MKCVDNYFFKFKVTKQRDPDNGQHSLLYQVCPSPLIIFFTYNITIIMYYISYNQMIYL